MSSFDLKAFQSWIEQRYAPVVLLRTTNDVEVSCFKNGLNFIDLVRPYEKLNKEVYPRTLKETETLVLKNFSIRFRTLEDMAHRYTGAPKSQTPGTPAATSTTGDKSSDKYYDFLGSIVREAYQDDPIKQEYISVPDTQTMKRMVNKEPMEESKMKNLTPWFDLFREEFLNGIRASSHEFFEHPVAVMTAVSTSNPEPIKAFKELFNPQKPPELFTKLEMDTDLYRYFVLIHDMQNGPNDHKVQTIFRKMKEEFGASCCRLLIINSRDPKKEVSASSTNSNEVPSPDVWTPAMSKYDLYMRQISPQVKIIKQIGSYLSLQDVQYISILVEEFITNGVLAQMQRKISQVNTHIVKNKKGFGNTLYKLFSAKKADTSENMQVRRIADFCFMLHDYDSASQLYKLITGEFKSNKENKNYAGTQEFLALCYLFTNGAKKDVESGFETAFTTYRQNKNKKFALRTALLQAMFYRMKGELRRAAEIFIKATSIEEANFFKAALLFEQTAICYLILQQYRKFAFFMIFAGYRYSHSNQIKHSYRCYKTSLKIYYNYGPITAALDIDEKWDLIFEHLSITMGRLSSFMQDLKGSVEYLHNFMCSCTQFPENQKSYMTEFLTTVREYLRTNPASDEFEFLDLPMIDNKNIRVLMNQYGTYSYTDEIPTGKWRELEDGLVKVTRGKTYTFKWDNSYNRNRIETSVVGEPIQVEFDIKNPLYIPIELSNLRLTATFVPSAKEEVLMKAEEESTQSDYFVTEPISLTLKPTEKKSVVLSICALKAGDLTITGVKWLFANAMKGKRKFNLQGKRLNETKQQRVGVFYEEEKKNKMKIVARMPLLKAEVMQFTSEVMSGQVEKSVLRLTNVGSLPMANVQIKTSHPSIVTLGKRDQNKMFPNDFQVPESHTVGNTVGDNFNDDLSFFRLDADDLPLEPRNSLDIPIFIRGTAPGNYNIQFLFYYEPVETESSSQFPFRLYRFSLQLKVSESVKLTTFCQPAHGTTNEHVIGITITNENKNIPISVQQITGISPMWTLAPLNFKSDIDNPMFSVNPMESTTVYFKISKSELCDPQAVTSMLKQKKLNVPLIHTTYVTGSSYNGGMNNSTSYPFLDFLFRESAYSPESAKHVAHMFNLQAQELKNLQKQYPAMAFSQILTMQTIINPNIEGRVFPFLDLHGLSMMVFWKPQNATTIQTIGQSHILKVKFLPEKKSPIVDRHPGTISRENSRCPLRVMIRYEENVHHNFGSGMCIIPVLFEITNFSPDQNCDCHLEFLSPSHYQKAAVKPLPVIPYLWLGTKSLQLSNIRPKQTIAVPMNACAFTPGTYNLNLFRIMWKMADSPSRVLMTFNTQQNALKVVKTDSVIERPSIHSLLPKEQKQAEQLPIEASPMALPSEASPAIVLEQPEPSPAMSEEMMTSIVLDVQEPAVPTAEEQEKPKEEMIEIPAESPSSFRAQEGSQDSSETSQETSPEEAVSNFDEETL